MDTNAAVDLTSQVFRVETRQDNTDRIIEEMRADMREMREDSREMREDIRAGMERAIEENRTTRLWLLGSVAAILLGVPAIVVGLFQLQGSWVQRDLDAQNARIERFEEREAARDARIAGVEEGLKQQKRDFDDFRRETAERFDRLESLIMGLHGKDAPRAEAGAPRQRR